MVSQRLFSLTGGSKVVLAFHFGPTPNICGVILYLPNHFLQLHRWNILVLKIEMSPVSCTYRFGLKYERWTSFFLKYKSSSFNPKQNLVLGLLDVVWNDKTVKTKTKTVCVRGIIAGKLKKTSFPFRLPS